ncbi:MAG TPA: SGNH/GDSL hydrolase family protein [Polyangiaceae bacterium]|nr:SGNH/GDSL hydrolase family protein [Polyangiaceae bacterium]
MRESKVSHFGFVCALALTLPGSLSLLACSDGGGGGMNAAGTASGGGAAGNKASSGGAGSGAGGSDQGGAAGDAMQGGMGGGAGDATGGAPASGVAPVVAAGVRWFGRVDVSDPSAIKFAWTGSGFVGTFTGPSVSVKLQTVGGGEIYFQPVVDGTPGTRFGVGNAEETVEIASGLAAGDHVVELYRETEGKGFGYSVFSGFAAGTPAVPPAFSGRLIEVIGDSISAGFGNLGSEQHPNYGNDPNGGCPFTTETESGYLAYGHVAARAVDAVASVLAGSGWGIYSDNGGNTNNVMPKLFSNTLGEQAMPVWSFAAKPQAVVINLGTNDGSANNLTSEKYKPAYTAFVTTIREKYPDALILCALGSMLSGTNRDNAEQYLNEIVDELGDDKVKFLDLGTQDVLQGTGCAWHPNVAEDARMAGLLEAELKASLAW